MHNIFSYFVSEDKIFIDGLTGEGEKQTELIIPPEIDGLPVTSICDYAFSNCTNILSVSLPKGVHIGENAFSGCTGIASVNIPDGVTFDINAFYGCTGIISVNLPDSLTSIAEGTFGGCFRLAHIKWPRNLTTIKDCAFLGCAGLKNITFPDSLTSIGAWAFRDCFSLMHVSVPKSATISDRAFENCPKLTICYSDRSCRSTKLKNMRMIAGLSQSQLAARAGVSVKVIQAYEAQSATFSRDINKAAADTIYKLATALGCQMEDLLELPDD